MDVCFYYALITPGCFLSSQHQNHFPVICPFHLIYSLDVGAYKAINARQSTLGNQRNGASECMLVFYLYLECIPSEALCLLVSSVGVANECLVLLLDLRVGKMEDFLLDHN